MRRVWILLLAALGALSTGCGKDTGRPVVANGEPAPGFELPVLHEDPTRLAAHRGHVVALRFWADWCPFCRSEMDALEPLYRELAPEGLEILAINVGQDAARVQRFVDRAAYTYPTLLDEDSAVARQYGVIAIPVTYVIDRNGIVRGRILGESTPSVLEDMVRPHLRADE